MQQLKHLVMTTLMLLSFITASAYDFMVDGLAYNVVSLPDLTCEVTYSDTKYSGDIVIPSTVTYQGRTLTVIQIGYEAFDKCSALTSVEIPNSVTTIGDSAFSKCTSLTSVEIPNSVTTIEDAAFYGCTSLTSIEIPNSVTKIDRWTFFGCSSLVSIQIPNSVTEIGESAFSCCWHLTSVEIPNSVTTIGEDAFNSCDSLVSIEIPESVSEIHPVAFYCGRLESITWGSKLPIMIGMFHRDYFESYIRSKAIKYLKILPTVNEAALLRYNPEYQDLSLLKSLSLGRSLEVEYYHYNGNGSDNFPNLTELELTGYVKYFKIYASSIKSITIDRGVELNAGKYGADMSKYDKLACITMKGDVPRFIPTFANATYLNAKLRVPQGTLQAYQNAEGWKNFWNIEEYDLSSGINEVPVEVGDKTECGRYDLQGRPVDSTYRGVTIIRYTDGSAKKVVTTR